MRLRVPQLLAERKMTAYAMHKASGGRISLSMAYRLAKGTFGMISADVLEALCDIFGIEDPGPLFARKGAPAPRRTRGHTSRGPAHTPRR
jgi:DNA-binding Xre family transcriptional regulator